MDNAATMKTSRANKNDEIVKNKQRDMEWHDQCHYYERDYVHLKHLPLSQAANYSDADDAPVVRCEQWEYDQSVDCLEDLSATDTEENGHLRFGIYFDDLISDFSGLLPWNSTIFMVFVLLAASNEAADLAAYVLCMEITGKEYRSIVGSLLQAPWACGYAFLALRYYDRTTQKMCHGNEERKFTKFCWSGRQEHF
ncbi:hypothetical protein OSTOST_06423 [Ostertagia ostertagi]